MIGKVTEWADWSKCNSWGAAGKIGVQPTLIRIGDVGHVNCRPHLKSFSGKSPIAAMWSDLVDDVEFGWVLYSDALKDSRRSIEEIVPFKLLWKARKDPINSFHQFWRNDNHRRTKSISNTPQIHYFQARKMSASMTKGVAKTLFQF